MFKNFMLAKLVFFLLAGIPALADTYTMSEGFFVTGEIDFVYVNSDLSGIYNSTYQGRSEIGLHGDFVSEGISYGGTISTSLNDVNEFYGYIENGLATLSLGRIRTSLKNFSALPMVGMEQLGGEYLSKVTGNQLVSGFNPMVGIEASDRVTLHANLYNGLHVYSSYILKDDIYDTMLESALAYATNGIYLTGSFISAKGLGMRDLNSWRVGVSTDLNGVNLGIDYVNNGDSFVSKQVQSKEQKSLAFGASVSIGEYSFAGSYLTGRGYIDVGNYANSYNIISIGLNKEIAHNWSYGADYVQRDQMVNNNKNTTRGIIVGTNFKF